MFRKKPSRLEELDAIFTTVQEIENELEKTSPQEEDLKKIDSVIVRMQKLRNDVQKRIRSDLNRSYA